MGKWAAFALVAGQCGHLCLQRGAYIHENIGAKNRLQPLKCPLRRRWHFERVNLTDAQARQRTSRGKHRAVNHAVVNVQVAGMMGIDHLGLQLLYQVFHQFHDIQKRHRVQTIVREV